MVLADKKLKPVMIELAYNLESFNPVFTAVLLKVSMLDIIATFIQRDQQLFQMYMLASMMPPCCAFGTPACSALSKRVISSCSTSLALQHQASDT